MKSFLALLFIVAVAALTYKVHQDRVRKAADEAAARAHAAAVRASREKPKKTPPAPPAPLIHPVAIARNLEPLQIDLFSELDQTRAADLVIPLELTRERILDQKSQVETGKQPIYDAGARAVASMIDLAEERTKILQTLVQGTVKGPGSLDSRQSATTSASFFGDRAIKRWNDEKARRKPLIDQLMAQLRAAERQWNQNASKDAPPESYETPVVAPVYITAAPAVTGGALERGAYNQRRVIYPWRRAYYDRNGYPTHP